MACFPRWWEGGDLTSGVAPIYATGAWPEYRFARAARAVDQSRSYVLTELLALWIALGLPLALGLVVYALGAHAPSRQSAAPTSIAVRHVTSAPVAGDYELRVVRVHAAGPLTGTRLQRTRPETDPTARLSAPRRISADATVWSAGGAMIARAADDGAPSRT
jgi:hypothetical protein